MDRELLVIASRPGMGKTALGISITLNVAVKEKLPVVYISFEKDQQAFIKKLLAAQSEISLPALSQLYREDDFLRLANAVGEICNSPISIHSPIDFNIEKLQEIIVNAQNQYGKRLLVVIDDLQLAFNEEEYQITSKNIKNMAKEKGIAIVILAPIYHWVEKRENKRPLIGDVIGDIGQWADKVWLLYSDNYYNTETDRRNVIEVICAKNRSGNVGTTDLYWDAPKSRMNNIES